MAASLPGSVLHSVKQFRFRVVIPLPEACQCLADPKTHVKTMACRSIEKNCERWPKNGAPEMSRNNPKKRCIRTELR
jgi:hypothetical protein